MRLFDLVVSGIAIFLLIPFLLPIVILLRLTGEGEIFYMQERVGRNGQIFKLLKFATMLKDSPNLGAGTLTMKNDPRVLPMGKFMRKAKLNELPQLYNIFKGDMALVGPRPLVVEGERLYQVTAAQRIRSVRPGLTGVSSLIFRDEEAYYSHRSDAKSFYARHIAPHKQKLELWYIGNRSLMLDLKIMVLTLLAVTDPEKDFSKSFKGLPIMDNVLLNSRRKNKTNET